MPGNEFELLKAYVTTQVRGVGKVFEGLNKIKRRMDQLRRPVTIQLGFSKRTAQLAKRLDALQRRLNKLTQAQKIKITVNQKSAEQAGRQTGRFMLGALSTELKQARLQIPIAVIDERSAKRAGERAGRAIGGGLDYGLSGSLDRPLSILRSKVNFAFKELTGQKIKLDADTKQFIEKIHRVDREAKETMRKAEVRAEAASEKMLNSVIKLSRAQSRKNGEIWDKWIEDQIKAQKKAEKERNRIAKEAAKRRAAYVAREQKKTIEYRRQQWRRSQGVADIAFARQVEGANRALYDMRRQLPSLGLIGKSLDIVLKRAYDAETRLRQMAQQARRAQNTAATNRARQAYVQYANQLRRAAYALSAFIALLHAAKIAVEGLKAALSSGLSILLSLIGGFIRLAKAMLSLPFGIVRRGILGLFAPTLGLLSLFKRLRSYLPLIFGGGFIWQIRNTITALRDFEDEVGRGVGNLGRFGASGIQAMEDMGIRIRKISLDTLISQQKVAEGFEELARGGVAQGYKQADQLKVLTSELYNVARLSLISGLDTRQTAKTVAVIRAQFGDVGEYADDLADALARAQAQAPIMLDAILKSFENAGATARDVGLSFEEALALNTKLLQNIASGSKAGTALSRGLLLALAPSEKGIKTLREMGIEMESFLDQTGQKFRPGGMFEYVDALVKAGAGLAQLKEIFDFRSRHIANLLNYGGGNETAQSLYELYNAIREAQKGDYAKAFSEFIRKNTFKGATQDLVNQFYELRLAIAYAFKGPALGFINGLSDLVAKISAFVRTSGKVKDFVEGLANIFNRLKASVGPLIARYARLSAVINTALIVSVLRLAEIISTKLAKPLEQMARKFEDFFGLPRGTLDDWDATFAAITLMIKNFEQTFSMMWGNVKMEAAEAALYILRILRDLQPGRAIDSTLDSLYKRSITYAARFTSFLNQALTTAIAHAIATAPSKARQISVDIIATKPQASIKAMKDLARGKGFREVGREWYDSAFNGAERYLIERLRGHMDAATRAFPTSPFDDSSYTDGIDVVINKLLMIQRTARTEIDGARSEMEGFSQDLIDLFAQIKEERRKAEAQNQRYISNFDRKGASVSSTIQTNVDFQKLLQRGEPIEQLIDLQRQNNRTAEDIKSELKRFNQNWEQGGKDPRANVPLSGPLSDM